ncbi:MAG: NusG domain II-containing protein [Christensenella sp.]|nr:NusG domain II-containing protein [Christensenella sp.]
MRKQNPQKKPPLIRFSDIVFTAAIVAVVIGIWFFTLPKTAGDQVVFRKNGQIVATLPLSEDAQYTVDGDYHNVFTISGGEVWVSDTNCPNNQCRKTGRISRAGQSIICAPNGVSATITGKEGNVPDGITG